ncbi:hemerythrin domain-containing protein [Flavobacterium acetivorans]|uniref:hemerythrin domain-containing protein n=1 Tax=Flavobacterium acetivorans TaxID=2893883 RepID=UPI001E3C8B26|nr:hemerythrin domain-containing protein [Flavobacterium sp. F-29]UFH34412.1 hemerythrin domain-containing protein [Flavobacterium sp. F-29]
MTEKKPLKRVPELQPLSHDHHHGLQLCWKIRTGFSKKVPHERIKKYTDWFYENHLKPHFELEEKYIFPVLDSKNELVQQALSEHKNLRYLFEQKTVLEIYLLQIEKELQNHIRFEERILFAEIQQIATAEQLSKINSIHTRVTFTENENDPFWI